MGSERQPFEKALEQVVPQFLSPLITTPDRTVVGRSVCGRALKGRGEKEVDRAAAGVRCMVWEKGDGMEWLRSREGGRPSSFAVASSEQREQRLEVLARSRDSQCNTPLDGRATPLSPAHLKGTSG